MHNFKYSGLILASVIALAGCPSDDTGSGNSDTDQTSGSPTSSPTSAPSSSATTPSTSATDTTPMTESDTGTGTGTVSDSEVSTSTGPDPTVFMFRDDPPEDYTRVDRMGLPAINTALILTDNKDGYNADDPSARAGGDYDTDIRNSLITLHRGVPGMQTPDNTGLDDDLEALGLVVCTTGLGSTCEQQIAPFVYTAGDQIPVDTAVAAGFPNGRHPTNAVIDALLALLLLEIDGVDQDGTEFSSIPLNPDANDVAFLDEFPYFAPAQ